MPTSSSMLNSQLPGLRLALAIAVVLLAAGCKPAGQQHGFPTPEVTITVVEPKDIPVTYEYVAQTAGFREVEVRARVTGILMKRNYREGAVVKKGDSLFTIDPAPFQVALSRAEADLAMAEARLAQSKRETTRLKPVIAAKAASQKEMDDAASAEQVADAEMKSARARVAEAKLNLDYTRVEAPITGVSSRSVVSEGALVSGPNVLLTTVTQTDPMYVIFGIPDREFLTMRRDVEAGRLKVPEGGRFKAEVKLADGGLYDKGGVLNFADVRVNSQTGTSEARAEFPNPGNRLRAGEFSRIVLSGAVRPGAIVVPQRSVMESPKGKYVYVVTADGKSEPRPLEVGDWTGDGWIINSGLKPGDRVVVDGVVKLSLMPPGVPVKIVDAAAPADKKGAPETKGPADKKGAEKKGAEGTKAPADKKAPAEKKV
jgi:membrane fusion protein (multidrug efflux system)